MGQHRAIKVADKVQAPTLLMGGVHDSLVAIEDERALARRMPRAELREYDCDHKKGARESLSLRCFLLHR